MTVLLLLKKNTVHHIYCKYNENTIYTSEYYLSLT